MAAGKSQKEDAVTPIKSESPAPSAAAVAPCGWMKADAKDGSFLTMFKDRFSGFIHAPMEEHKACFKNTIRKMVGKVSLPKRTKDKWAVETQAAPKN